MIKYKIDRDSMTPVYLQLKEQLKAAIDDGRLQPLSPMPLVTTIAKEAGVSLRTADNALMELVKDGICFRRPKKGTFVQVKNVLTKQTACGVLGCPNSVSSPLDTLLHCGIMEASARKGILTLLFPSNHDSAEQEEAESLIRRCDRGNEFDLKGVLFLIPDFDLAFDLAKKFPNKKFFLLNHGFDKSQELLPNMASIVNDDFFGAYQLTEFVLAEYRPSKPVIISSTLSAHNHTYVERCRGFNLAAKEYSLKPRQLMIPRSINSMKNQIERAYSATKQLFESDPGVDCVLCVNDLFAHGACKAADELGLLDQICITGYDCIHHLGRYEISTVKVPYTEIGKAGLEKMLEPEKPMGVLIKLSPEIIKVRKISGKR